jgi:hypothetical protein
MICHADGSLILTERQGGHLVLTSILVLELASVLDSSEDIPSIICLCICNMAPGSISGPRSGSSEYGVKGAVPSSIPNLSRALGGSGVSARELGAREVVDAVAEACPSGCSGTGSCKLSGYQT